MRRIEDVSIDLIDSDPENARKTFLGIDRLAKSIEELGLLENLVVVKQRGGRYQLKAGERRLRAIRKLAMEKRHPWVVPCLVLTTNGEFEAIAENIARHAVPVWEMGDKYMALIERGYMQEEIGEKAGVPRTTVSQYIRIARGLGERTRTVLSRMPNALTMQQYERLAGLVTKDLDPDEKAQIRALDSFLGSTRKKRKQRDLKELPMRERLFVRYRSLKYHVVIPSEARPMVEAVLNFMDGTTKHLNLKPFGIDDE